MNAAETFARFSPPVASPLSMITCYDSTMAALAVEAGIDVLLVGDSVANTMLGFVRTADIGMPEMLHHVSAVRRGAPTACIVGDMPFGSDTTPEIAVENGLKLVAAGADAVKLEGALFGQVGALRQAGVQVVGHLGLLPQTAKALHQAARDPAEQEELLADALALQKAGCCAIVLEHIPGELGARVTRALNIPTVGIGAGNECAGQVLVLHDVLGLSARQPPFARRWADLRQTCLNALSGFALDVAKRQFP